MMNASHGPAGSLAGLLMLCALHAAGVGPTVPVDVALVAGSTAGALLPDADHHSSSTALMWGPLTRYPCAWVGKLAGGHRAATHDVSKGAPLAFGGVFGVGLCAPLAGRIGGSPGWVATVTAVCAATVIALIAGLVLIGAAAFIPGRRIDPSTNFVVSWLTAGTVMEGTPGGLPVLVIAAAVAGVTLGVVAGIAGDACTISGVPWRGRDVHLLPAGRRIRTGSDAEVLLVRYPTLAGVCVCAAWLVVTR